MHRCKVVCTKECDFVKNAKTLRKLFVDKGYEIKIVDKYCGKFLRRHMPKVSMKAIRTHSARDDARSEKEKHGPGTILSDATNHENEDAGRRPTPPRRCSSPPKQCCDTDGHEPAQSMEMECDCN